MYETTKKRLKRLEGLAPSAKNGTGGFIRLYADKDAEALLNSFLERLENAENKEPFYKTLGDVIVEMENAKYPGESFISDSQEYKQTNADLFTFSLENMQEIQRRLSHEGIFI